MAYTQCSPLGCILCWPRSCLLYGISVLHQLLIELSDLIIKPTKSQMPQAILSPSGNAEVDTHEIGNTLSYRKSYHMLTCPLLSLIFRKPHLLWGLEPSPSWYQICVSWKLI